MMSSHSHGELLSCQGSEVELDLLHDEISGVEVNSAICVTHASSTDLLQHLAWTRKEKCGLKKDRLRKGCRRKNWVLIFLSRSTRESDGSVTSFRRFG